MMRPYASGPSRWQTLTRHPRRPWKKQIWVTIIPYVLQESETYLSYERQGPIMISEKMTQALNRQITNEFETSHSYLAMSACFEKMGLTNFARRFFEQATEEREHALKLLKYLHDVDSTVRLGGLAQPPSEYPSAQDIVEAALASEQRVTKQINELVALTESENDYTTRSFLQWYIDEQVEEVSEMHQLLQWMKIAGEGNLFLVEARLATGSGDNAT